MDEELTEQVLAERRHISRYTGLFAGRILLLICLLLTIYVLRPVSTYMFVFFLLIPWVISGRLSAKAETDGYILFSSVKKYHYSDSKYTVEQCFGWLIIVLLIIWQLAVNAVPEQSPVKAFPSLMLFLYLICRLVSTVIVRRRIHRYYTGFSSVLDVPKKTKKRRTHRQK